MKVNSRYLLHNPETIYCPVQFKCCIVSKSLALFLKFYDVIKHCEHQWWTCKQFWVFWARCPQKCLFSYLVSGWRPARVCLKTPGLTVLTSTLLTQIEWRKFEFEGIHEIEAEVLATFVAVTEVGPSGASFPTTTVQAASKDVRPSEAETVLTLMRWIAERSKPEFGQNVWNFGRNDIHNDL